MSLLTKKTISEKINGNKQWAIEIVDGTPKQRKMALN